MKGGHNKPEQAEKSPRILKIFFHKEHIEHHYLASIGEMENLGEYIELSGFLIRIP